MEELPNPVYSKEVTMITLPMVTAWEGKAGHPVKGRAHIAYKMFRSDLAPETAISVVASHTEAFDSG